MAWLAAYLLKRTSSSLKRKHPECWNGTMKAWKSVCLSICSLFNPCLCFPFSTAFVSSCSSSPLSKMCQYLTVPKMNSTYGYSCPVNWSFFLVTDLLARPFLCLMPAIIRFKETLISSTLSWPSHDVAAKPPLLWQKDFKAQPETVTSKHLQTQQF